MLSPLLRAIFVCSLLVVVSCRVDRDELLRQKTSVLMKWLRSLLPSALVGQNPYFCLSYDCPWYIVSAENELYETRKYDDYVSWLTCPLPSYKASRQEMEVARQGCFQALSDYLGGENVDEKKMKLAFPVIERLNNSGGAFMAFFIPSSAPAPTNVNLTFVVQPPTSYYVRSFTGYGYDTYNRLDNWAIQTDILMKELKKDGLKWGETQTAALYDKSWSSFSQHNEVWLDVSYK